MTDEAPTRTPGPPDVGTLPQAAANQDPQTQGLAPIETQAGTTPDQPLFPAPDMESIDLSHEPQQGQRQLDTPDD